MKYLSFVPDLIDLAAYPPFSFIFSQIIEFPSLLSLSNILCCKYTRVSLSIYWWALRLFIYLNYYKYIFNIPISIFWTHVQ
jgi:hypothetical protein